MELIGFFHEHAQFLAGAGVGLILGFFCTVAYATWLQKRADEAPQRPVATPDFPLQGGERRAYRPLREHTRSSPHQHERRKTPRE